MPPVSASSIRSVRRTVASSSLVAAACSTDAIRRTMPGADSGSSASSPPNVWPGPDREQVGAEPVERGQQVGLARLRDAQHRHHRGDPDRHAERRQGGAQPPRAQPEAPTRRTSAGSSRLGAQRRAHEPSRSSRSIPPSRMCTRRGSDAATSRSWVITTIVVPSAFSSRSRLDDLGAGAGVEVAGRLVGEHDRRAARRAPGRSPRAGARRRRAAPGGARAGGRGRRARAARWRACAARGAATPV